MAIDVTRVKRTRNGSEVRIYATDSGGLYPIHGAFKDRNGIWTMCGWDKDGFIPWTLKGHQHELIEEPRTIDVDVWLSVYPDGSVNCWGTREIADTYSNHTRIACVNIKQTVTEGEGL